MRILILHRVPFLKIGYDRGIDHTKHDVTYIGTEESLKNVPEKLPCTKIIRIGKEKTYLEVIEKIKSLEKFDRIISNSEYELLDAAMVRQYFNVQGPTVEEVLLVRNKLMMKKAVKQHGIKVPNNLSCQYLFRSSNPTIPWNGRTVLKPVDGASSENVFVFNSSDEAKNILLSNKTGIADFDPIKYEIEEFIEGPILHIDGLVQNSSLLCSLASRYIGTCLDYAMGKPLASIHIETSSALIEWVHECLQAVKIKNGAFHLEAILTKEGPVFLEVGNRVGGADVVETFERATGIHLSSLELKILLGEKINIKAQPVTKTSKSTYYGWFVFPGHHLKGPRFKIKGARIIRNKWNIVRWNQLSKGQKLPERITYQYFEVPVAGVIRGKSPKSLEAFVKKLFKQIEVQS